jgi:DNA-binding response OmpR family regulator
MLNLALSGSRRVVHGKRILVVDDDRSIRQIYRTALMLSGFRVDIAEDGLSALRRIEENRPDLIVLDLHLPQVDGLAVLGELRANTETWNIPVVVVTGADHQYAVAQANAILRKPCDPDELIEVIERHIRAA